MKNAPLRILHVCPRPTFSGLESWVVEMARHQARAGLDVSVVALAGSPLAQRLKNPSGGPPIETVECPSERAGDLRKAVSARSNARRPDVLHLHSSQDFKALVPWIAVRRWRGDVPAVVLQSHIWISHSKRDPVNRFLYRWVDAYWCSSEPARRSIEALVPIDPARIRVVRYGRPVAAMESEMATREDARRELGLPADAVVVGTVSRIDRGKGSAELLEAGARAMARRPRLWLSIVGGPTDDPKEVRFHRELLERAASLPEPVRERVRFHGPIQASHRVLRAFDLFALPTYRECFSLALMEAQLAGLPCVATDAGGSPELVREGVTGWLCEPESARSLEDALERALSESDRWSAYGSKARDRARTEFDMATALDETTPLYREAVSRSASSRVLADT